MPVSSGPSYDPEPRGLKQIGCAALAVAAGVLPFVLWFGVPWWMDRPDRAAADELKKTMTTALRSAARRGGVDQHAALRAARASASQLRLFRTGADGVRIDVEQYGDGDSTGNWSGYDVCLRFTVTRSTKPTITAADQDRCAGPPSGRAQAAERIGRAAERTRGTLAAAVADGPLTRERARALVRSDLSDLWSFHPSVIVVDYIALTRAGAVEAAECAQFTVVPGAKADTVDMYRLQQCPSP